MSEWCGFRVRSARIRRALILAEFGSACVALKISDVASANLRSAFFALLATVPCRFSAGSPELPSKRGMMI